MIAFIFDLLFPKVCIGCRSEGSWFCKQCLDSIEVRPHLTCPDCDTPTKQGYYCANHKTQHAITRLIYVADYKNKIIQQAIQALKYDGIREFAQPLGYLLAAQLSLSIDQKVLLIPIPLHSRRKAARGFNQSELIAQVLPTKLHLDILVRHQTKPSQTSLSDKERRINVRSVFGINPEKLHNIQDKKIILIDDVSTTGSTLDAAAEVLLRTGARQVWGAVIAKG